MCFQSAARSLFVGSSDDPFLDNYIETISQMNAKEIMMLPKMDDDEFLQYFFNDNHTAVRGKYKHCSSLILSTETIFM